ncbi:MAG: MFS transporter permease [Cyanobacteriota bacterium]|nr:MFS transporter permease [Cyanobacteriota bacterium]
MYTAKFSDAFFAKLISDISANDNFKFTKKQLYYLLNKRLIKKKSITTSDSIFSTYLVLILTIIGISSSQKSLEIFVGVVGVLIVLEGIAIDFYKKNKKIKKLLITPEKFQDYLNSWKAVNPIDGLLTLSTQTSLPSSINSDITSYSFDRVVVCDSAEIANLLIANNFHFENNSAVLSIDGYPENIFDTVMQMLRRNEDLKVYVLHDASPKGVSVVNTISTNSNWFSNNSNSNITIYDLGLLPRQVFNNSNFFTQISEDSAREAQELSSKVKEDLTEKEIKWLEAGKYVELESFTPQRLLRVVSQGILNSRQSNNNSGFGDSGIVGSMDSSDDCDITIFADDCFG